MKEIKQKFVSAIGTALSSTYNPKEHAESIFSTVKSFLCEICQKSFQTIHSLNSHKKIHFEKTFLCSFCTKKVFTFLLITLPPLYIKISTSSSTFSIISVCIKRAARSTRKISHQVAAIRLYYL